MDQNGMINALGRQYIAARSNNGASNLAGAASLIVEAAIMTLMFAFILL
jgi:hypothetical protein